MPSGNVINDIEIVTRDGERVGIEEEVDYISFVNDETYGIPALISEERLRSERPFRVLYVNPQNIASLAVTRES